MPVLTKVKHREIIIELNNRYSNLRELLESRDLTSSKEGAQRGMSWVNLEDICATKGNTYDLELAVSDFKSILSIIGKLK